MDIIRNYTKFLLFLGLLFLSSIILSGGVSAASSTSLANSSQPKYQHDNQNTGQSQYMGPTTNTTKWVTNLANGDVLSPVIGSNGTIYVGTRFSDGLYAVNPNGSLKWSYTNINGTTTIPAISSDGTIYIGTVDGLYAFTPNGSKKWRYTATDTSFTVSNPSIGSDGTIYIIDYMNNYDTIHSALYAINPNGTKKWSYNIPSTSSGVGLGIIQSQVIGRDGTIYINGYYQGNVINFLYSLNPNGTLKWKYTNKDDITTTPSIGSDGTIYMGSDIGYLYAINPTGTLKWSYNTGGYIRMPPVISKNGTIYTTASYYNSNTKTCYSALYAINPNDTLKWMKINNILLNSPATIGADGTIYISAGITGQRNGILYAINPTGSTKWVYHTPYDIDSAPAISSDGTLYFGTWDGKLYALSNHLNLTTTTNTTVNSTVKTITPVSLTSTDINNAATHVQYYVDTNGRLPSYITIANHQVTMPQFLMLITANLLNINKGLNTPINLEGIIKPNTAVETVTSGLILKSEYLTLAGNILNVINKSSSAPSSISTSRGVMNFNNLVYSYCKILVFQSNNQRLPNYVTVKTWNSVTNIISVAVLYSIADEDNQFMDIQGTSDAASLIRLGYGDCWANSEWLYNKLTATGVQARIMGYVNGGYGEGYRHAWIEINTVNGWQSWDYIGTHSQHYGNLADGTPFVLIGPGKSNADILSTGY